MKWKVAEEATLMCVVFSSSMTTLSVFTTLEYVVVIITEMLVVLTHNSLLSSVIMESETENTQVSEKKRVLKA